MHSLFQVVMLHECDPGIQQKSSVSSSVPSLVHKRDQTMEWPVFMTAMLNARSPAEGDNGLSIYRVRCTRAVVGSPLTPESPLHPFGLHNTTRPDVETARGFLNAVQFTDAVR